MIEQLYLSKENAMSSSNSFKIRQTFLETFRRVAVDFPWYIYNFTCVRTSVILYVEKAACRSSRADRNFRFLAIAKVEMVCL